MKQILIGQNKAYATSSAKPTDYTTVAEGTFALFDLVDNSLITAPPKNNFCIVLGRAANKMPLVFPEVDVKTLQVTKAEYEEGKTFKAKITIPTPKTGRHYTVILTKKGTVFNERSNWSFVALANTEIAADVAKQISAQINANKEQLGVTATYSGGAITITGTEIGKDFEVTGADQILGVEPTEVIHGKKAVCDKAYIQDLASRCAAGKGFNYLADEGKDIYPGYPEPVDADKYVLYTLRFAVPRVASKQRDEVVYQLVHLAVPVGAGAVATLDSILGVSEASGASLD